MYLELRRRLYHAVLTIPLAAREELGKMRFVKSTGTGDKRKAQIIANLYVAGWKLLIDEAIGKKNNELRKAIEWREIIEPLEDLDKESITGLLDDEVEAIEKSRGFEFAKLYYDVAVGQKTLTEPIYQEWKAQLKLEPKTIDQMVRDVALLINKFTTIESMTADSIYSWAQSLESEGRSISSRRRIIKFCRNYWGYLRTKRIVPSASNPFDNLTPRATGKSFKKVKANAPYTPEQIKVLYNSALSQTRYGKPYCDEQLANIILLSAYTGARIEELCSLRIENVDLIKGTFNFTDSKTEAGIRELPIHSALNPLVKKLKDETKDDFLISGLPSDKYNKRSGVISKRFSILKTKLGFGKKIYTAHSFRSSLATMLENAGVAESVAADLLGHQKRTMTYGLYSGGTSLNIKREALEKVKY